MSDPVPNPSRHPSLTPDVSEAEEEEDEEYMLSPTEWNELVDDQELSLAPPLEIDEFTGGKEDDMIKEDDEDDEELQMDGDNVEEYRGGSSEEFAEGVSLVDIDKSESSPTESAIETQTNEAQGTLSFEDPRFFQLDDIIGPDDTLPHVDQYAKRKVKRSCLPPSPQQSFSPPGKSSRPPSEEIAGVCEGRREIRQRGEEDGEGRDFGSMEKDYRGGGICNPDAGKAMLDFEAFAKGLFRESEECVGQRRPSPGPGKRERSPSGVETPETQSRSIRFPSIESMLRLGEKSAIRFHILKDQKLYSKDVRLDRTIGEIKKELACIVKVPAEHIELRRHKNLVMDYKTLEEIGAEPGKTLRMTIDVSKSVSDRFHLDIPQEESLPARDPVTRSLHFGTARGFKTLLVTIHFPATKKPYLGGYRDKLTKTEYHHAQTQTTQTRKTSYRESQVHRACQAFRETDICIQTVTTTYTQVDRRDYYVCSSQQTYIRPKPYHTADWWDRKRGKAAVTIQRYWRRWLAIKEKKDRLQSLLARVQWAENLRKGRTESRLALKEEENYRQFNPTTLLDMELLYRAINTWKKEQIDYVLKSRWGAEKKAALADIMEKEADLLLDLERAKSKILKQKESHHVQDVYLKMGNPSRRLTSTGAFVTLDTPGKSKSRDLHQVYIKLQSTFNPTTERLSLLQDVYLMVKDVKSTGSEYLIQLIGREVALIQRKSKHQLLEHLRKRVATAFFNLCTDLRFNPESHVLHKVPFDERKLRKDMIQCRGCKRMLPRDQFTITRGVNVTSRCKFCNAMYTKCVLRLDLNLYRRMLQELRRDEQSQGVDNSIAYLIDAYDLQFLIEQLWHGQSALSSISDRYILRLCRWDKDKPWSPWNCVLLTEEEAVSHLHIQNMESAYQSSFLHKVRLRHSAARSYFQRTDKISKDLIHTPQKTCIRRTCP